MQNGILQRIRHALEDFGADQSGSAMTEFVIMLPAFVLVFQGVIMLGEFTRDGSEPPVQAYVDTFDQTTEFQKADPMTSIDEHMQPSAAAIDSGDQLMDSPAHNKSDAVAGAATTLDGATYTAQGIDGTTGESAARINTLGTVTDIEGCKGPNSPDAHKCVELGGLGGNSYVQTGNSHLVGQSEAPYANAVMNDSPSMPQGVPSGSGALGALNMALSSAGVRPAIGAGIRYGTVTGRVDDSYEFMGRSMDQSAYYNNLVPPATTGGSNGPLADETRAIGVTRLTMEGQPYHAELPGIAKDQPLKGTQDPNADVPDLPAYK